MPLQSEDEGVPSTGRKLSLQTAAWLPRHLAWGTYEPSATNTHSGKLLPVPCSCFVAQTGAVTHRDEGTATSLLRGRRRQLRRSALQGSLLCPLLLLNPLLSPSQGWVRAASSSQHLSLPCLRFRRSEVCKLGPQAGRWRFLSQERRPQGEGRPPTLTMAQPKSAICKMKI